MRWTILLMFALATVGCSDDAVDTPADCEADDACQVFLLVNEERESAGVAPLQIDASLEAAAQLHAEDMFENGYFDHTSQDGRNFSTRANEAGYDGSPGGENIANGQQTPEQVMQSWMNSDGHRNNILNPEFDDIGVGKAGALWVQVFGRR